VLLYSPTTEPGELTAKKLDTPQSIESSKSVFEKIICAPISSNREVSPVKMGRSLMQRLAASDGSPEVFFQ
jgi:hypothetical protein